MAFEVAADHDRFMGRYSAPLAVGFADRAAVRPGQRVLDIGCGPGALIARLVELVGAENVSAVDLSAPSLPPFASGIRQSRWPRARPSDCRTVMKRWTRRSRNGWCTSRRIRRGSA